jgi:hypothetical protein
VTLRPKGDCMVAQETCLETYRNREIYQNCTVGAPQRSSAGKRTFKQRASTASASIRTWCDQNQSRLFSIGRVSGNPLEIHPSRIVSEADSLVTLSQRKTCCMEGQRRSGVVRQSARGYRVSRTDPHRPTQPVDQAVPSYILLSTDQVVIDINSLNYSIQSPPAVNV